MVMAAWRGAGHGRARFGRAMNKIEALGEGSGATHRHAIQGVVRWSAIRPRWLQCESA